MIPLVIRNTNTAIENERDAWSQAIEQLKRERDAALLENNHLRHALEALYDDWNGPLTEALKEARLVLYGDSPT